MNPAIRILRSSSATLLTVISVMIFQNAHATLYLSEPFDYPSGPLTNAIPWSTNGTAVETGVPSLVLVGDDLPYSPITDPGTVNHTRLQWSSNVKGIRQISDTPLGDPSAGGTVYASFNLYKATTNGSTANTPILGLNVTPTETINQAAVNGMLLYHQQSGASGNYRLGIKIGGGTTGIIYPPGTQIFVAGNTNTGDFGQTNFIVMKYTFNSGAANDTVALWVNPDPSSFSVSEPVATTNDVGETTVSGATDANGGLKYFQIRAAASGGAAGTLQLDDLRVGSTWADVTPTCVAAGVTDPANQATSPGQTATFSVIGSGAFPTYQWQTNRGSGWFDLSGATNSSYTTPPEVSGDDGLQFRCVVSVACNGSSATSAAATLTVQACVTAGVTDPTDQTVNVSQTATFSVTGNGSARTFQWQTNKGSGWFNINGATSANYTTPPTLVGNDGLQFRCVVHVNCDNSTATSAAATLHVICNTAGVTNPQNQVVIRGQTATFSVVGSGSNPTYQWATNGGGIIAGATNSSFTTPPTVDADYGLQFVCTVSVACDGSTVTSAAASLIVNCDGAGTTDPVSKIVGAGQTVTFSVVGSGSLPTFQWQTNNGSGWFSIPGATNASYLTAPEALTDNNLQFRCVVSACGPTSATSAAATLNVFPGNATFLSIASGNLSDPNTWEQSYDGGITWTNPAAYPPTDNNSTNVTIQNGHIVVNPANSRLDQVIVQAGGQLSINTGTTLTITNGPGTSLDISGTVDVTGSLVINTNAAAIVRAGGILETEQGGTYTVTGTLAFSSGATYLHNYTTGAGIIPTATWNTGSTCEIIGFTSDITTLAGQNQSFYNFLWNCPNQTAALPFGGTVPTAINGDFTVTSTGTGEIRLANNNSPVLNVLGNVNILGGRLTLASGANGKVVINAGNNVFIATGGALSNAVSGSGSAGTINFVKAGTQIFTNGGALIGPINWVVKNGSTLNGTGVLSSNLTLETGAQIRLTTNPFLFSVVNNVTASNATAVVDVGGGTLAAGTYPLMNFGGSFSGALTAAITDGAVSGTAAIDAGVPNLLSLAVISGQPHVANPSLTGTSLTISGNNGTPGVSYGVLGSTNVALPLTQWTPVIRNGVFDGTGNFNTNVFTTNAPQQFLIIQSPSP